MDSIGVPVKPGSGGVKNNPCDQTVRQDCYWFNKRVDSLRVNLVDEVTDCIVALVPTAKNSALTGPTHGSGFLV